MTPLDAPSPTTARQSSRATFDFLPALKREAFSSHFRKQPVLLVGVGAGGTDRSHWVPVFRPI